MKGSRVNFRHREQAIRDDLLFSEILNMWEKVKSWIPRKISGQENRRNAIAFAVVDSGRGGGGGCKSFLFLFFFFLCVFSLKWPSSLSYPELVSVLSCDFWTQSHTSSFISSAFQPPFTCSAVDNFGRGCWRSCIPGNFWNPSGF